MSERRQRKPAWGKIIAGAVAIAALAAAWRYTPLAGFVTAERVSGWARTLREMPWAPVVLILVYTPAAFLMFPRPLLTLFGIIAFGPWLGFAYGMTGIILSALATYYVGIALPANTVKRIAGEKMERVSKRLRKHGLLAMVAIRLVPAAPFAVEGIVAGAVRIRVWPYTLGTFIGMLPGVLAMTVFGTQITNALQDLSSVNYWLVGGTVLALVILTVVVGRWLVKDT